MDAAVAFGKVLRKLRREVGLWQKELGFAAGLQRKFVSLPELGRKQPTSTTMLKLTKPPGRRFSEIAQLIEACLEAGE